MKKQALIITMLLGMAVTIWAQGFPVRPHGGGDEIQPIGPVSDDPAGGAVIQPGPGVAAAVPEPSTISLLVGGAALSSWFFLRRRR